MKTKTIVSNEPKYFVKKEFYGDHKHPIKEIYESFNGWYWFVTAYEAKGTIGYGLVHGIENDWGTFYMADLNRSYIWKVPKANWSTISFVEKVG